MLTRSWIAILLLINYLWVVGAGCVNRPEDQRDLILVQTHVHGHAYQQCRYLRMDGLEDFLNEALANRYKNTPDQSRHHLLSVIGGVDAHCFWPMSCPPVIRLLSQSLTPTLAYSSAVLPGVYSSLYAPPWIG